MKKHLANAELEPADFDAVAVTEGPGLVGALLIGVNAAKAFAFANGLPIIGVHHIAGHIYANQLMQPMEFPLACTHRFRGPYRACNNGRAWFIQIDWRNA